MYLYIYIYIYVCVCVCVCVFVCVCIYIHMHVCIGLCNACRPIIVYSNHSCKSMHAHFHKNTSLFV